MSPTEPAGPEHDAPPPDDEPAEPPGEAADVSAARATDLAKDLATVPAADRASERARERALAIGILDLQEGLGSVRLLDDDGIAVILGRARRIALIGASSNPARPSFAVFRYLLMNGYECIPVNPNERDVLGQPAFRTLTEAAAATGPFDIVDVFRRSELCLPHATEAVQTGAGCLWLQLGVVNWEAAAVAAAGGLSVVMNRCTAIEHRALRDRR
jgi:uncharacterized protein